MWGFKSLQGHQKVGRTFSTFLGVKGVMPHGCAEVLWQAMDIQAGNNLGGYYPETSFILEPPWLAAFARGQCGTVITI